MTSNPKAIDSMLLLGFSIAVTALWFNNGNLAIGGDVATIPFDPSHIASRYLSAWNFWIDAGNPIPTVISNQVPALDFLFYYSLRLAGLPLSLAQGIYIVLFSYFVAAVGTYLLVMELFESKLPKSRLAGLLAGIFAVLNPIYVYYTGYTYIVNSAISRASLPVALFLTVAGFRKKSLKYALGLGLCTTLCFSVFARAMEIGFLFLMSLALAIPYVPRLLRGHSQVSLKFMSSFIALACLTAIIVNLYWIAPFSGTYAIFSTRLLTYPSTHVAFESQFATIPNTLRLMAYWPFFVGNYVPYVGYYQNPAVWAVTFALPIVVLGGLMAWRKCREEIAGLTILLGIIITLCLGTNLPFGIFTSMIQFVPFFKLFQDPWVFLEPLSMVYSVLFGVSIALLAQFLSKHVKPRQVSRLVPLALAMMILLTISWPAVSGSVFVNWYQPSQRGVSVPPEYSQLNSWLMQDNCSCATMLVPQLSGSYLATSWGFQGPNVLYQNLISTSLVTGSGPAIYGLQPSAEKQVVGYVYTIISNGNPIYAPSPINATINPQDWHYSVSSQATADSITSVDNITPWNESTMQWSFEPISEGSQNGHSIYFAFNTTRDISKEKWALMWASSSADWSKVALGIGDDLGNVSWYPFADHQLITTGDWNLFGFPLVEPDVRTSNLARTNFFYLDYGLFSGQQVSAAGSGTLTLGPILLSTGHVSEDFIEFMLGALNVKYLVVDRSIDRTLYPRLNVGPYESNIASWTHISLIKSFGGLLVYENPQFRSMVSAPEKFIQVANLYNLPSEFTRVGASPGSWGFLVVDHMGPETTTYNATIQSVKQLGPTDFRIELFSQGNFFLLLSTAFDNNWFATSDGVQLANHVLANGYSNGWVATGSGEMSIEIKYHPQEVYDASLLLSIIGVVVACVALVTHTVIVTRRNVSQSVGEHSRPTDEHAYDRQTSNQWRVS